MLAERSICPVPYRLIKLTRAFALCQPAAQIGRPASSEPNSSLPAIPRRDDSEHNLHHQLAAGVHAIGWPADRHVHRHDADELPRLVVRAGGGGERRHEDAEARGKAPPGKATARK